MRPGDEQEVFGALRGQAPTSPEAWDPDVTWGFADVEFTLPNGWTVVVNQRGETWNYVDSVRAPDGREFNPYAMSEAWDGEGEAPPVNPLTYWHPMNPRAWGLDVEDAERIELWNMNEHAVT